MLVLRKRDTVKYSVSLCHCVRNCNDVVWSWRHKSFEAIKATIRTLSIYLSVSLLYSNVIWVMDIWKVRNQVLNILRFQNSTRFSLRLIEFYPLLFENKYSMFFIHSCLTVFVISVLIIIFIEKSSNSFFSRSMVLYPMLWRVSKTASISFLSKSTMACYQLAFSNQHHLFCFILSKSYCNTRPNFASWANLISSQRSQERCVWHKARTCLSSRPASRGSNPGVRGRAWLWWVSAMYMVGPLCCTACFSANLSPFD